MENDDFTEPCPSRWAIWHWPRAVLLCLAVLMVFSGLIHFDMIRRQHMIAAMHTPIDAASRDFKEGIPTKDWEFRLQELHDSRPPASPRR